MGGIRIEAKIKIGDNIRKEIFEFGVGSVPYRKSKCLYKMRGAMVEPLAYFTSEQNAEEFDKIIDFLVKMAPY